MNANRRLIVLAAVLVAAAWSDGAAAAGRTVVFRAEDGVSLTGTWYEPSGSKPAPAVIFVHMLHRSRRDWDGVAARLAAEGIGALTLDLRGHGESGGSVGESDPPDYSALTRDVAAARRFLASRADVQQGAVGIAGASLGANLAALYASTDTSLAAVALLSPSLDYRGLRIEQACKRFPRPMLLVASDDDPYATRSARDLEKAGGGPRELLTVAAAGHGTTMLTRDEYLAGALVDWFKRTLLS